ncbi:MAG: AMIN domain-containing protein [Calditrichaeota bacterium]|nr:MAG: AMIN domain-containing protein [Calditrichota bacterium]
MIVKKIFITTIALALILTSISFASQVTDVELNYSEGFTVAKINIDGDVRYTHQTVIAKDGKPYRVIVDILSATHELGAKNFYNLPACPVKAIRSSQYSVSPEKVVRLVFDMDAERVYRIDSDLHSVSLYFSDKSTPKFANWSSSASSVTPSAKPTQKPQMKTASVPANESKSTKELNSAIDNDRMLSLSGKSSPVPDGPKVDKPALNNQTEKNNNDLAKAEAARLAKIEADKKAKSEAARLAKIEADKKAKAEAARLAKIEADKKAKEAAKLAQAETANKEVSQPAKKSVASKSSSKPAQKSAVKKSSKPVVAKTPAVNNAKKEDKSKTSRFRRNPVSNKIRGTMVAQFPKRLVIKYQAKAHRDPFATLIDESKKYNNPVEARIPNVEGLKLVGIIQSENKGNNRALFEDNDGYGYILKSGDKVRKGYVLRVDAARVYFQIFEYGWSRTVALNLES